MLFYDSSCFQLSFIYHNHHGQSNRLRDATFAIYGGVNFL